METAIQRVTITIDDELDAELDRFMKVRGYAIAPKRSAISPAPACSRRSTKSAAPGRASRRSCISTTTRRANCPKRLTRDFHEQHDLAQATLHVHLDHESCMEVTVLKGRGASVQQPADHIIAERGIRHGHVVYLPADGALFHGHGEGHSHGHPPAKSQTPRTRVNQNFIKSFARVISTK